MGYSVSAWVNFGVGLAAIAGALVGLLFVAASVRSGALATSRSLSSRAAQTLVLFLTSVVVALALLAPQPDAALGWELVGWALVSGAAMLTLDHRAGHEPTTRAERFVQHYAPNTITAVFLAIAGATFLAKHGGGLSWLLPTVAGSLLGGVVSAWFFLISDN